MNEPERPDGASAARAARRTPYELVFHPDEFEARLFPGIRDEAEVRAVDPLLPEQFGFLSLVGDAIRRVVPPDASPETLDQYRSLFYHAFNFWRFGKRVYLLEPALARYLVEAAPALEGWELDLPHPSVYVQLPLNLFWSSISTDAPAEPVDGFFVTSGTALDAHDRPFRRLEVLAVLGIRRHRAGFGVVPFHTEVVPGVAEVWAETPGREPGKEFEKDFQSVLPGGDLARLYSILTTGEILKLLARAFWYLDAAPGAAKLERAPEGREGEGPDAPPLPRIPYYRVSLTSDAAPPEGEG